MTPFATFPDPSLCALALDDRKLERAIPDITQLLSTVICKYGGVSAYAATMGLHPWTLWAESSRENFQWLALHGLALVAEHSDRFPKKRRHLSAEIMREAARQSHLVPTGRLTVFPNTTPFKHLLDPTVAYRLLLCCHWHHSAQVPKWTKRPPPPFLITTRDNLDAILKELECEYPPSEVTPVSATTH